MTDPFSIKPYTFPEGFIFGSATAGHQIEGNNVNSSNYVYELEKAKITTDPYFEPSGMACNSYNMFEEDNKILSTLKHKMYRMSIEWSRIEPNEGDFRQDEVDHYVKIFESLKQKGIKICLSLTHGTVPAWFWNPEGYNSFYKMDNLHFFERYVNYVVPKIEQYVDYWLVLNEANAGGGLDAQYFDWKINTIRYHARAYHVIKQYSNKPVSSAIMFVDQTPKRQYDRFDNAMSNYADAVYNESFLHAIRTGEIVMPYRDCVFDKDVKDSCDFWSINSYGRRIYDARKKDFSSPPYNHNAIPLIKDRWTKEFYPECMISNLTRLMDKPVLISENGIACANDEFRIVYIAEFLSAINDAIKMGVNVFGYLHWSLLDNYEWGSFLPTFGLVEVDRNNNFKRTIKKSAYFYRDIIENNGFNQEILRKYLTHTPVSEFSNYSECKTEQKRTKENASDSKKVFEGGIE